MLTRHLRKDRERHVTPFYATSRHITSRQFTHGDLVWYHVQKKFAQVIIEKYLEMQLNKNLHDNNEFKHKFLHLNVIEYATL